MKKNEAVAAGPYDSCSTIVRNTAVRKLFIGNIFPISLIQPYIVGATKHEPYVENCAHLVQSYDSLCLDNDANE